MRSPTISAASSLPVSPPEAKAGAAAIGPKLRVWADRLAPAAAFVALILILWEAACRLFAYSVLSVALP